MRRAGVGSELKALPTLVPVAPWDGKDYAQGSSGGHRKFVHPAPSPSTPIIHRRGEGGGSVPLWIMDFLRRRTSPA